ncbi:hypothetical protein [Embleya sp. NPDC005971]|uniref:hypothetical protein n=1 Tax=Embleya sp. NPDC005971 TaxID=3156724 RepID=UPI00340D9BC5
MRDRRSRVGGAGYGRGHDRHTPARHPAPALVRQRPRLPRPRTRPPRHRVDRRPLDGEWLVLVDDHDPPYPNGVALEADGCAWRYGRSHYEHADPPDGRLHWVYDTA